MKSPEVPGSARLAVAAAALLNLIPVFGVLFWGWSAFALIFLYWLENVVIGVRTLASMLAAGAGGGVNALGALFFCLFFTIHYGLFCFVHGGFVVGLFGGEAASGESMFDLFAVAQALLTREPNLLAGLVSIVLWQAVIYVLFLARGQWRGASLAALMGAPYPRIIILHLAIIFGGFVLMALNQPLAGLVMLALVKAGFDVAEALGKTPRLGRSEPDGEPAR